MNIKPYIKILKSISILKTLFFNLKAFPLKEALRLPVLVGKCVVIKNIGSIILDREKNRLHLGTLQLFNTCNFMPLIWDNKGCILFRGGVVMQPGVCLHVSKNGQLTFEGNNYIGTQSLIACHRKISFGHNTQLSWNCQICDTDFHFIKKLNSGEIRDNCASINIGQNVWIGNHVIVSKGVSIANGCIIGQNSFVNKSINDCNKIAIGNPVKTLDGTFERIWDCFQEQALAQRFHNQ